MNKTLSRWSEDECCEGLGEEGKKRAAMVAKSGGSRRATREGCAEAPVSVNAAIKRRMSCAPRWWRQCRSGKTKKSQSLSSHRPATLASWTTCFFKFVQVLRNARQLSLGFSKATGISQIADHSKASGISGVLDHFDSSRGESSFMVCKKAGSTFLLRPVIKISCCFSSNDVMTLCTR